MTIGIHAEADLLAQRTGVEEYLYHLLKQFTSLAKEKQQQIILYYRTNRALDFLESDIFSKKELKWPMVWTQIRLAFECLIYPPDILFVPAQIPPFFSNVKTVITVHGLEFLRYPAKYPLFKRKYLYWGTKIACKRAAAIIAVSESTKKDLMHYLDVPENKITVIYHGFSGSSNDIAVKSIFEWPYFIYIGRVETKKNIDGLIKSFTLFKAKTGYAHKLVLAGKRGFGFEKISSIVAKSEYKDDIIFTGYVDEKTKFDLLKHAAALVFPSWYEGFGFPILEAQSTGTAVITSDVSSMGEVSGDGAILINPESYQEISAAMALVVDNLEFKRGLIDKGFLNLKRFSWEKCARETFNVLINA
ncbi:MAG: hypothetical protein UU22_C0003G0017 [Parcubacteria group bacterium GW2011_GWA2_40_8]|nr:MAG: hypothetical protein UU22_C0003G0017 [Parcubacteria group bacterium GW2011_GWA2_40_8]